MDGLSGSRDDVDPISYLFSTDRSGLPDDPLLMPTVGNGNLATVIWRDRIFMNGFYNGCGNKSHRAAIPALNRIVLKPPSSTVWEKFYLDCMQGVFTHQVNADRYSVRHEIYAHRTIPSVIVNQITIIRSDPATHGDITIDIESGTSFTSPDINLESVTGGANGLRLYNGYIKECEVSGKTPQIQFINICVDEAPTILTLQSGMRQKTFTFIMSINSDFERCQYQYDKGQSYFKDETMLLKKFTPRPRKDELSTAATLDVNKPKNRYSSVLPMDSNRVKLSLEHGESDYINAIYYDSYRQSKAFILTQTPMPETLVDFWRMIWEKGVCSIVMMDDDRLHDESCASYWPDVHEKIPISPNSLRAGAGDSTASHLYGQFYVQLLKVQRVEDICITRHMLLTNKLQPHEPSRHVKQFQVLEWPLNQIKPPKTGLPMLRLMDKVEAWHHNVTESYNQTVASPVVVHCLDGAVHSGVYVAAAVICEKMRDENQVNVFLTVKEIKHKRKDAIGTLHQYKYLHRVLWDFINLKLEQRTLDTSNNTYISQRPSAAYQNKLQHSSPPRHDRLQHSSPPRHNISHQDTYESYENESDEVSSDNDQFDVQIRG